MALFSYLLQVSACLSVIYALYFFFFKKELFSRFNRFYLLLGVVLSFLMPLMPRFITLEEVPEWSETTIYHPIITDISTESRVVTNDIITSEGVETTIDSPTFTIDWQVLLLWIYMIGVVFIFIKMLFNLTQIGRQIHRYKAVKKDGYWVIKGDFKAIYSFFNYVFWNDELPFSKAEREQILSHELVHVKDRHSIDILLLELVTAVLWFNPLIYFYKKSLKNIHEYIADRFVFEDLNYQSNYAQLLIKEVVTRQEVIAMTHPFFNSLIKKRLLMLNQTRQPLRQWKLLIIVPVLSSLLLIFGVQKVVSATNISEELPLISTMEVVKDNLSNSRDVENVRSEEVSTAEEYSENNIQKNVEKDTIPKGGDLSPEWIAEMKRVEAGPNPWLLESGYKKVIQIDGDFDFLFKIDGSRRTPDELKAYVIKEEAKKGNVYTKEEIVFYTNKQLTEWVGIDMMSMKEVEEFGTGRIELTWTGFENGQLTDLNQPENQRFQLWDKVENEFVVIEEYNIYLKIDGQEKHRYSFTAPKDGNIFPSEIFELMKQMKSGDEIILDSFKFQAGGIVCLARDKYNFEIK